MITCRQLIDFLMAYFDEELPGQERDRFEEHLAVCPACVAYMKTYAETIRLGKAVCQRPDDPVPPDVPEDLVKAILAAREKGSS